MPVNTPGPANVPAACKIYHLAGSYQQDQAPQEQDKPQTAEDAIRTAEAAISNMYQQLRQHNTSAEVPLSGNIRATVRTGPKPPKGPYQTNEDIFNAWKKDNPDLEKLLKALGIDLNNVKSESPVLILSAQGSYSLGGIPTNFTASVLEPTSGKDPDTLFTLLRKLFGDALKLYSYLLDRGRNPEGVACTIEVSDYGKIPGVSGFWMFVYLDPNGKAHVIVYNYICSNVKWPQNTSSDEIDRAFEASGGGWQSIEFVLPGDPSTSPDELLQQATIAVLQYLFGDTDTDNDNQAFLTKDRAIPVDLAPNPGGDETPITSPPVGRPATGSPTQIGIDPNPKFPPHVSGPYTHVSFGGNQPPIVPR